MTKPEAAEKIIRSFATRSYRRPVTEDEVAMIVEQVIEIFRCREWMKRNGMCERRFGQECRVALEDPILRDHVGHRRGLRACKLDGRR